LKQFYKKPPNWYFYPLRTYFILTCLLLRSVSIYWRIWWWWWWWWWWWRWW